MVNRRLSRESPLAKQPMANSQEPTAKSQKPRAKSEQPTTNRQPLLFPTIFLPQFQHHISGYISGGRLPDQASTAGCNTPEFRKGENCGNQATGVHAAAGYIVYRTINGAD